MRMLYSNALRGFIVFGLLAVPVRIFAQGSLADMLHGRTPPEMKTSVAPQSSQFPDRWYPEKTPTQIPTFFAGLPYIAVEETRSHFKMENGEIYTRVQRHPRMRDSAGRERSEWGSGGRDGIKIYFVQVMDPVSHCSFQWSISSDGQSLPADERIAVVRCATRTAEYIATDIEQMVMEYTPTSSETARNERFTGTKDGIGYVGVRNFVRSADPGAPWVGTETWYSKEMHLKLRSATVSREDSNRDGEELTKIRRTEPDVQLFYPPGDYAIYTESELRAQGQQIFKEREATTPRVSR